MGQYSEALDAVQKEPDERSTLSILPLIYWAMGRRFESDAALKQLKEKYANAAALRIAEAHAYRGEIDAALEWLDRAFQQRESNMVDVKFDPFLRSLHKDRRFRALLVKMKLDSDGPEPRP